METYTISEFLHKDKYDINAIDKFIKKAMGLIDKYHVDSKYIIFEITENTYIHNVEAVNRMIQTFHQRGIRISMDDFDSGYSSLNTLKEIIFD